MDVSAIILTKNEEKSIKDCMESVKWCSEIIVIDDFSTDETIDIAKKLGAKIYQRKLNNDFAAQRNFALGKANSKWVFFLDADERISNDFSEKIIYSLKTQEDNCSGYYFRRYDCIWGREIRHGETGYANILRLANKGMGKWRRAVYEYWDIKGTVNKFSDLDGVIMHYPYQKMSSFVADIDRYSTIHAQENSKEGKKSNLFKIIFFPKIKFLYNYFLKFGFLDGHQGFMVAMLMSFSTYLAWSKLWVFQKRMYKRN